MGYRLWQVRWLLLTMFSPDNLPIAPILTYNVLCRLQILPGVVLWIIA